MKSRIVYLLLLVVLVVGGCKEEKEEIKIGIILPLTGELAPFGEKIKKGIQLAVDEYNGFAKNEVKLFVEDDKGEEKTTVNTFSKLHDVDGIDIIIGTLTSGGTLSIAPIAQRDGVLLMSPTASSPMLSDAGSLVYRVWSSDNLDGIISAEYSYGELNLKKVGIVYQNNDYCGGLAEIYEKTFTRLGGQIPEIYAYNEGNNNFKTIISRLKAANCDGVYLPGHPIGIASYLKQAREQDFNPIFISNVAVEDKSFIELAGTTSDKLYYTSPSFDMNSEKEVVRSFVNNYQKKYSDNPDIFSVKGYEAARIILEAIRMGNHKPVDISKYIDSVRKFSTIEGDMIFDNNGDVITSVSIKQIVNSQRNIIKIINPK